MIKKILKNGLKVFYEKKNINSVAIEINVKTGSINETKETAGISHLIEHLVFKNTRNRSQKQITSAIEDLGGELNAFTDNERTAFHSKILNRHFDVALDILSDLVLNPLFLEKDIKQEKGVVIREIDTVKDMPLRYQTDLLPTHLFRKHPLGNMIIGTKESIKKMSRKQILDYYSTYYSPNNMCISIVGNVKNPFRQVEKLFMNSKPSHIPSSKAVKEPEVTTPITYVEKRKMEGSYFSIGFKISSRGSFDSFVLDVINAILGEGMSSRLWQEIREKRSLVYAIHSANKFISDTGYFIIYSGIKKENIPRARKIILEEIKKLKNISEEDIRKAITKIEGSYLLKTEDNEHLATEINYWETNTSKPELVNDYLKMIRKVTKKHVQSAIDLYFKPNSYCQIMIQES